MKIELLPEVQGRVPLSRSTILRRVREGLFPQPVRISARLKGWRDTDIDAYLAALPLACDAVPKTNLPKRPVGRPRKHPLPDIIKEALDVVAPARAKLRGRPRNANGSLPPRARSP